MKSEMPLVFLTVADSDLKSFLISVPKHLHKHTNTKLQQSSEAYSSSVSAPTQHNHVDVCRYLGERPPVHIGAPDVDVLAIHDPE